MDVRKQRGEAAAVQWKPVGHTYSANLQVTADLVGTPIENIRVVGAVDDMFDLRT